MVTIWEASVVGSVRTLDISHPKQKWADLLLSTVAPAIHLLNVCVCGLAPQLQISISIDTQPRVSPLNRSL